MTAADDALAALLDAGAARAAALGPPYRDLWAALTRACDGGKRLRPALLHAAHDGLGGTLPGPAADVGAALELLHTAFVVHDDVIDGDLVRRGRPNVSGTFAATASHLGDRAARAYADAAGVLAGDLALVAAVRAVALCGAPPDVTTRLLDLVDAAVQTTAAGELDDVRLGLGLGPVPSLGDVLTVSERKTAVYSFVLPLQAGAVLAGADGDTVDVLGQVGRLLGIGFQLVDDLLGVFGDEATTGKSSLTDLREGKWTPLVAHARSTSAWLELAPLLGDPDLDADGARRARDVLVRSGSRDFVEDLALGYVDAAAELAYEHRLPEPFVAELEDVATSILDLGALRPVRAAGRAATSVVTERR